MTGGGRTKCDKCGKITEGRCRKLSQHKKEYYWKRLNPYRVQTTLTNRKESAWYYHPYLTLLVLLSMVKQSIK